MAIPPRPGHVIKLTATQEITPEAREHAGRRQVADVPVDDTEKRTDGRLIGGDRIEIADVDGPPLVRMVADF